jgi:hypothetical protein
VQEDAIGYAGGLNLYWYGDGDPTNGRDPDGLMKNIEWAYDPFALCLACREGPAIVIDGAPVGRGGPWLSAVLSLMRIGARMDRAEALRAYRAYLAGQPLTEGQRQALGNFCELRQDACDRARLTNDCGVFCAGDTDALTWGGAINFEEGQDLSATDDRFIALLAHELTHVAQWLDNPWGYNFSMIWTWTVGRIFNPDPYQLPSGC